MAEIICFDKGGRDARRALVGQGRAPREFFYGVMDLQDRGYDIEQLSSGEPYGGPLAALYRAIELAWSHLTRLGLRTHFLDEIQSKMARARVAVSFTDGFSLTLGYYYRNIRAGTPFLVGCFHGLSDFENKPSAVMRPLSRNVLRRSLQRLDHVAFFGPADREVGISRYGLDRDKTSIILFGVDTGFWTPGEVTAEDFVFSMGQDPNRDFATLVGAEIDVPVRLHTALPVVVPPGRNKVTLSSGSYHRSTLSDEDLRDLYRRAMAVVVPLKDVYQPTGYSVTLQAMACGKPVVLSRIRGLWAPELLRDGENCILVPPGDRAALAAAVNLLAGDAELRARLGRTARETVERHFNPRVAAASLEALIQRGLAKQPRPPENGVNGAQE
jgi:glycosyltransferase involved in cell wall biosynthesis